ncbi:hypothetical protein L9F63_009827 [Diploptera punctata]|uniref:Gustatory receptor n=1 Tax=Diploptera punctata TaxID=6984 RepID=A0AAD8AJH1_DIPPU|nr:hypothetical protein L9F63_009827 [Diploptera punctata]
MGNEEIFKAARPLFYVWKLFGLAPYTLNISDKRRLKTAVLIGLFYQLFIGILIIAGLIISIESKQGGYYITKSKARITSSILYWTTYSLTSILSLIFTGIYHKKIVNILKVLSTTDDVFSPLNKFYKNISKFIIIEVLIIYSVVLAIAAYHYWVWFITFKADFHIIGIFLYSCIVIAMEIQFTNITCLLYFRFKALNDQFKFKFSLTNTIEDCNSSQESKSIEDSKRNQLMNLKVMSIKIKNNVLQTSNVNFDEGGCFQDDNTDMFTLRVLRKQQHLLRDVADDFIGIYGILMISDMVSSFIGITVHLYTPLYFANNEITKMSYTELSREHVVYVNLCWFVLMFIKLICICTVCQITSAEASRTATLLRTMLLKNQVESSLTLETQIFLEQVVNRPMNFTAYGFFNIDYSFLCSFVGAVATYIIILVQFN